MDGGPRSITASAYSVFASIALPNPSGTRRYPSAWSCADGVAPYYSAAMYYLVSAAFGALPPHQGAAKAPEQCQDQEWSEDQGLAT